MLVAGLLVTGMVVFYVKAEADGAARRKFDFASEEIELNLTARLQACAQVLYAAAALFDASVSVERGEWRTFVQNLELDRQLPGIQGVGFVQFVPRAHLTEHIQSIRRAGFPDYQVTPAGGRENCAPVIYVEPFTNRNLRAFGYDLFSEPVRRAALERARDQHAAALTGKVTLVQETNQGMQAGTLMFVPVYRHGLPLETVEQRRAAIQGWVYSPYRMGDLMRGTLREWKSQPKDHQLHFQVYDGDAASQESLLFDSEEAGVTGRPTSSLPTRLSALEFAGRRWTLRFTKPGGLAASADYASAWIALWGGTLVSLLLSGLTLSQLGTRARAQRMAEQLTQELSRSEARLHRSARTGELLRQALVAIDACSDLDAALDCLLRRAIELAGMDGGAAYRFEGPEAVLKHQFGLPPDFVALVARRPLDTGYVNYALAHPSELITINQQFPDQRALGEKYGLRHVYCIGLSVAGVPFGYVNVASRRAEAPEQGDIEVIRILALETEAAFVRLGVEHRLRATLTAMAEGVVVQTADGRIVECNPGAERILGLSCDQIKGRTSLAPEWQAIDEAGQPFPGAEHPAMVSLRTGRPCRDVTMGLQLPDVTRRWILSNAEPLFSSGNSQPYAVVTSFTDITARKSMEEALRETQAQLVHAMDQAELAYWEMDAATRTFTFNDRFYALYGTTAEREGGYRMPAEVYAREFLPAEERHLVPEDFARVLACAQDDYAREHRIIRRDGQIRHFVVRITVARDTLGRVVGARGSNQDITARKELEEQRAEALDRLQKIASRVPGVVYQYRLFPDGRSCIPFASGAMAEAFRVSPEEIALDATQAINLVYPVDAAGFLASMRESARALSPWRHEFRAKLPDGTVRWLLGNSLPEREADGSTLWHGYITDITEHKQAEAALRESEEKFRLAFSHANAGMCLVDLAGKLLRVNKKMADIFGYHSSELERMNVNDLALPEHSGLSPGFIQRAITGGGDNVTFEKHYRHRLGHVIYGEVSSSLVRDAQGEPLYFISQVQDITARKQTEAALRASEANLHRAQAIAHVGDWSYDFQNDLVSWSPEAYRIYGVTPASFEHTEKGLLQLAHPEDLARQVQVHEALFQGRAVAPYQYRIIRPDGGVRVVEVISSDIGCDESGQVRRVSGTVQDITARQQLEAQREEALSRLQKIASRVPGVVYQYRLFPDGRSCFPFASPGIREIYRVSPEEVVADATKVFNVIHPEDLAGVAASIQQSARDLTPWDHEYRVRFADGAERWLLGSSLPEREADGSTLWHGYITDITGRKRMEEAKRESEAQFRATFEQAAVGMAQVELDGGWLRVNDRLCEITGYSREELLGKDFQAITHPADLESDLELRRQLLSGELSTCRLEKRYIQKSGSLVIVNLTVSLVRDESGAPKYFVSVTEDITVRKRAEEQVKHLAEELNVMLGTITVGVIFLKNRRIQLANVALDRIFGYPAGGSVGLETAVHYVRAEDSLRIGREGYAALARGEVYHCEVEMRRLDGSVFLASLTGQAINPQDLAAGSIWQLEDISERKRAETALRQARAHYQSLLETASDGIHIVNREGRLLEASHSFYVMLGYSAENPPPLFIWDWDAQWSAAELLARIQELLQGPLIFETRHRRRDGQIIEVEINSRGIDVDGERLLYASARDITSRKQAEAALRASLLEKTVLLKEVHHRVKNNLQIVSSLLSLQQNRTHDAPLMETLASTGNRVRSMALIHEKLYQSKNLANLDLANYVGSLCRQLHNSAGSVQNRVRIDSTVTPPDLAVGLDQAVPCGLVINELVSNALKYAFPGERPGRIRVTLQRSQPREILLTVADDGVGLPVALDPAHTASLGLKLVYLLADQLHGTVRFTRAAGTVVEIRFPYPSTTIP